MALKALPSAIRKSADRHCCSASRLLLQMRRPLFYITVLGLLSQVVMVSAQPGPITISNPSNLVIAASTLLTNGLPGLSGPPVTLMVSGVQPSSAQGGTVSLVNSQQWVDRYNGTANNEDQATAIAVDNAGNIIVGGYSDETAGLGYLTIKYTPGGVGLWTNRYQATGDDQIQSVAVDGSGGVYVSGLSGGNITTLKYTSSGVPVWTNIYVSPDTNNPLFFGGLAVDSNGNAYILPSDLGANSFITVKYDVNGNPAWTNLYQLTPVSTDNASDIAVDAAGNVFVTGFDSTSGALTFLTVKYGTDGSTLWANIYSLVNLESASRVIVDPQGNVIVAGDSQGGTASQTYPIVKYSNSGTPIWTNVVAAAGYAGGGVPDITTDPAGNVFLVGGTPGSSSVDYTTIEFSSAGVPLWTNRFVDPNGGSQDLFGAATDNAGNLYWSVESASPYGTNYNYVTLKYAANGAAVWTNRYTGPSSTSDNTPRAMTVDKAGGVYVTGTSSSAGQSFGALDWATVKYADNLHYTPPPHFVGQDTITFTAFDSFGNSATGTLVINVVAGPPTPLGVVAPAAYTSVSGNGALNTLVRNTNNPRTYQMQFTSSALGGLPVGARITALGFRLYTNTTVSFPGITTSWSQYQVTLAQAANPISTMSTTFQANMLNPVLVKSGALSISPNQFTANGNPYPFGTLVVFDTPYVYQGGDLVMYFTHSGSDSSSAPAFLDAATNGTPGYGTSFRALSATTFGATTGAAASVTIAQILFIPTITQTIAGSGNQIIINGAGGLGGATYRILTTTNVALPLAQWTPITTNQFSASGGFSYTNVTQPTVPAEFFRVSLP